MKRSIAALLVGALAACGGAPERPPDPTPDLLRLEAIEDERNADAPDLAALASSPLPAVRARAAVAMGRMLNERLTGKLLALAADSNAVVRRTAIWGLGQFGFLPAASAQEREIVERLKSFVSDPEESVRASVAEALGKLAGKDAPAFVTPLLRDRSAIVRGEAAFACVRWRRVLRMRGDKGDLPQLPAEALEGLIAMAGDTDDGLRWHAAYVLTDRRAASVLAKMLTDGNTWTRMFAARSLKVARSEELKQRKRELSESLKGKPQEEIDRAIADDERTFREGIRGDLDAMAALQEDAEYFVRLEAVNGLVGLGRADLVRGELAKDPSYHVRTAVAAAGREDLLDVLTGDASPVVRAAVVTGRARLLKAGAKPHLAAALASRDWIVREAAVEAAATLGKDGLGVIAVALEDPNELVQAAAVGAAGEIEGAAGFGLVKAALASPAIAIRGAAVDALGGRQEPEVTRLAMETYDACQERMWVEVRETIVDVVAKSETPETTEWLKRVFDRDPAAAVRRKAAAMLRKRKVDVAEPKAGTARSPYAALAFAENPVVVLETTRGRMLIECFPREALVHVANFVGRVREGFYNGLAWHRVVPNFVIQGGDPLGNGSGDGGFSVRAEINEERYTRGAVGMPRAQDFDTGGCQIFITHVPTPHLDGLYTVFGRVIEGLDVIDAIERSDRITKAYVRE